MGSLTLSLAAPTLLSQRFELQANTGVSNAAGGRSSNAWTAQATVFGRMYAPKRFVNTEQQAAGRPQDLDVIEVVLDTTVVDPAWRVKSLADGRVFEIVSLATQPPVTIVRARRVA